MAVTDSSVLSGNGSFSQAAATSHEHESVELLMQLMEGDVRYDVALRALRASDGDLDKAAVAMLEGNIADEIVTPRTPPPSKPERPSPPVIDLTGDNDEELSRALAASLEDPGPTLRPSDRAPDPNWAVVPSNVEVNPSAAGGLSQEQQHINRAIEASLNYEMMDTFDELPLEQRVRIGDTPVSLRPTQPTYAYAGLVVQGLFFVPQVKHAIARYRPIPDDLDESTTEILIEPPRAGPDHLLWTLLEAFANMDLARLTELNIDEALDAFGAEPWKTPAESPGDMAFQFYSNLAWTVETVLSRNEALKVPVSPWPRLFHFRFGSSDAASINGPFDKRHDMSIVRVTVPGTPDANDLLSCLALELSMGNPEFNNHQVIFEPSDVVAFQLHRTHLSNGGKNDRTTFNYPKCIFLDQFLKENAELAAEKRKMQRDLYAKIETLKRRREALTSNKDRNVLSDLRAAVHYYENIADDLESPERKGAIHDGALRLRKILTKVENELQTIDLTISKHQAKAASTYDCPQLQNHRYDLRVVLVHDGLYGRNHIYSYVKQRDIWWKILDYNVTQVSEGTVYNDSVGLHLNAGPFFLLYSRSISSETENAHPPYPLGVKDSVKHNNIKFLGSLPLDIQARAQDPNSPPSTPALPISQVPSLSSSAELPASPKAEFMDID